MVFTKHKLFAPAVLTCCLLVFSASPSFAQDTTSPSGSRTVASGQKMKIKGVVTRRDADTFTVQDMNGVDTVVRLNDKTSVKTHGGFLRGGTEAFLLSSPLKAPRSPLRCRRSDVDLRNPAYPRCLHGPLFEQAGGDACD